MKSDDRAYRVVWQLSNDGLQPTEAPWGFVVRNPVTRSIPPGMTVHVNTNVVANCAMLAFPTRSHMDDLTVSQIIQAGQEIIATVENKSKHVTVILEDKEGLVNLHPLIAPRTTSEVG